MVGQRYLTHESDDDRWEQYRKERSLKLWRDIGMKGVNETYNLSKSRSERVSTGGTSWCLVTFILSSHPRLWGVASHRATPTGHANRLRPLVMPTGYVHWPQPTATPTGHADRIRPRATPTGHADRLCPRATPTANAFWLCPRVTPTGDIIDPWLPDLVFHPDTSSLFTVLLSYSYFSLGFNAHYACKFTVF